MWLNYSVVLLDGIVIRVSGLNYSYDTLPFDWRCGVELKGGE